MKKEKRGKTKQVSKKRNKKGQEIFGLSFGMIFAVILIIFFVFVAFIVIQNFLNTRDCAKIGIFNTELNDRVNDAWNSGDITNKFNIDLPSNVQAVCFANLTFGFKGPSRDAYNKIARYDKKDNLFLYAPKKTKCSNLDSYNIEHLDLAKITINENPYCINLTSGKGKLIIEMDNSDDNVRIRR
jgi:hypothetical protein